MKDSTKKTRRISACCKGPGFPKCRGHFLISLFFAQISEPVLHFPATVYIDGEDEDDTIEFTARRVPRDPEDFAYDYAYGREILLSAVIHLHGSQDTEAIQLLERQLLFFRFNGFPNL